MKSDMKSVLRVQKCKLYVIHRLREIDFSSPQSIACEQPLRNVFMLMGLYCLRERVHRLHSLK